VLAIPSDYLLEYDVPVGVCLTANTQRHFEAARRFGWINYTTYFKLAQGIVR